MGCGSSAFDEHFGKPAMQDCLRQFRAMHFSNSDIRKLYDIFRAVDVDGSGSIALSELLTHIHLDRTTFTEKVFSIFDDDKSGEIDFKEFVMSLWNYCTLTKATLDLFAFDLYDRDGSGELSPAEVTRMVQDIYGKGEAKSNFHAKSIINELHALDLAGKVLNIEHFSSFAKNHHALLFPAFQMQSALRRNILGAAFWEKHAVKRTKFTNGKYVSVGQFVIEAGGNGKSKGVGGAPAEDNKVYRMQDEGHEHGHEEAAGGHRAAKRKSAARHQTDRQSFGMDAGAVGVDGRASLTESAKIRFMASLMSLGVGKQRRVSVAPAPAPIAGQMLLSPQDSSLITSPGLSHGNSSSAVSSVPPSRKLSVAPNQNGVILNAAAAGIISPFVSPREREHGKREANRRHSREDVLAGTVSPGLTMTTGGKVEQFTSIEAWQSPGSGSKQPRGSTGSVAAAGGHAHGRRASFGGSPPTVGMLISDHPNHHTPAPAAHGHSHSHAASHGNGHVNSHGHGQIDAGNKRRRSSFGT